jgi:hypothetical protein
LVLSLVFCIYTAPLFIASFSGLCSSCTKIRFLYIYIIFAVQKKKRKDVAVVWRNPSRGNYSDSKCQIGDQRCIWSDERWWSYSARCRWFEWWWTMLVSGCPWWPNRWSPKTRVVVPKWWPRGVRVVAKGD